MLIDIEYKILNKILKVEKGLRPSEIREICNLTEPTLHKYLKSLCKGKYLVKKLHIKKGVYPHSVFYSINKSIKEFLKMAAEFKDKTEWLDFYTSPYCKNMITPPLIREIEKLWNISKPYKSEIEIEQLPLRESISENFSVDDVIKMLKLSPTALKKSIEGSEWAGRSYFEEMLIASIILDSSTHHYPRYTFKPVLSIEIKEPGVKEPFFKSAGTTSIHQ